MRQADMVDPKPGAPVSGDNMVDGMDAKRASVLHCNLFPCPLSTPLRCVERGGNARGALVSTLLVQAGSGRGWQG